MSKLHDNLDLNAKDLWTLINDLLVDELCSPGTSGLDVIDVLEGLDAITLRLVDAENAQREALDRFSDFPEPPPWFESTQQARLRAYRTGRSRDEHR